VFAPKVEDVEEERREEQQGTTYMFPGCKGRTRNITTPTVRTLQVFLKAMTPS